MFQFLLVFFLLSILSIRLSSITHFLVICYIIYKNESLCSHCAGCYKVSTASLTLETFVDSAHCQSTCFGQNRKYAFVDITDSVCACLDDISSLQSSTKCASSNGNSPWSWGEIHQETSK